MRRPELKSRWGHQLRSKWRETKPPVVPLRVRTLAHPTSKTQRWQLPEWIATVRASSLPRSRRQCRLSTACQALQRCLLTIWQPPAMEPSQHSLKVTVQPQTSPRAPQGQRSRGRTLPVQWRQRQGRSTRRSLRTSPRLLAHEPLGLLLIPIVAVFLHGFDAMNTTARLAGGHAVTNGHGQNHRHMLATATCSSHLRATGAAHPAVPRLQWRHRTTFCLMPTGHAHFAARRQRRTRRKRRCCLWTPRVRADACARLLPPSGRRGGFVTLLGRAMRAVRADEVCCVVSVVCDHTGRAHAGCCVSRGCVV